MANFIDGKFRKNYQVPYSLLMGLNCALGSNRRQGEEKHPKKWRKTIPDSTFQLALI